MRTKVAILAACIAAAIALSLAGAPSAEAGGLKAAGAERVACSLPYVDDVNEWGAGKLVLTVTCCGQSEGYQMKAKSGGKQLKVVKHKPRVWSVVVEKGAYVKLSVRPKGGVWRSIGYRVY